MHTFTYLHIHKYIHICFLYKASKVALPACKPFFPMEIPNTDKECLKYLRHISRKLDSSFLGSYRQFSCQTSTNGHLKKFTSTLVIHF